MTDYIRRISSFLTNRTCFVVFFLLVNCMAGCAYTYQPYQRLLPVALAWGLVLLLDVFFRRRTIYRCDSFWLLFAFGVSYGVTILLNYKVSLFSNVGQLLCTCIYFFILFGAGSRSSGEENRKLLRMVMWIAVIWTAFLCVTSLWMYYTGFRVEYEGKGFQAWVGLVAGRTNGGVQLFGISASPSILSESVANGILAAIYLLRTEAKTRWRRIALWVILALAVLTLAAADAFTGLICILGAVCAFVLLSLPFHNKLSRRRIGERVLAVMLAEVVMVSGVVGCYRGTQKAETVSLHAVSEYRERISQSKPAPEPEPEPEPEPGTQPEQKPDESLSDETLSQVHTGRTVGSSLTGVRSQIWREGLKLFAAHPLGVTEQGIEVHVEYGGDPDYAYYNLHNGYLTILVAAGAVGFLLIMAFGLWLLIRAVKHLYAPQTPREERRLLCMLISIAVGILAADLVNGCFVLWRSYPYVVFWLVLGYIAQLLQKTGIPEETAKHELS